MSTVGRIVGWKIVIGVPSNLKNICPAPAGKLRLRLRGDKPAVLFAKFGQSFRVFHLRDETDKWVPVEIGANYYATI